MHIIKKLMSLTSVCTKAQCPCKALDICHYVCLPKEGFIPKETSETNSGLLIYQKSPTQVVKPHSMHVNLISSKLNSYHQTPKKTLIDKTTQSTPHCILTPRCLSCKKIQRKMIKFNNKQNKKHKKNHLLKRKTKIHIVDANKIKKKIYVPTKCLQHFHSIKSSSQGTLGHNVQYNKAIVSLHTNQRNSQPKINNHSHIPSCKEHSREEENCGWGTYTRKLLSENSQTTSPSFIGYENEFCSNTRKSYFTKSLKLLEDCICNTKEHRFQHASKTSKINHQRIEIQNLPPPLDLLNYSQGTVYIDETSNVPICNLFLPCKSCHCHKIEANNIPCQKDTFCKFCPCHKNVYIPESIHHNPKLQPKTFIEPPKIYCTSQIVGSVNISSTNCKEHDLIPLECNSINTKKINDLSKNISHLKDKNLDNVFKWNAFNNSQTPISSCSMASTSSLSRIPLPHIEVKSQSNLECKNKFLKQPPFLPMGVEEMQYHPIKSTDSTPNKFLKQPVSPLIYNEDIKYHFSKSIDTVPNKFIKKCDSPSIHNKDTQCTNFKSIDTITSIENAKTFHKDNQCNFPNKCTTNEVGPLIETSKCHISFHNVANESCGQSNNCFLETNILPMHVKAKNCPSLPCSYPSPKCSIYDCHNNIQNQISNPIIPSICQSNITKTMPSPYVSSLPSFLCKTNSPPMSLHSWNTLYDSTHENDVLRINSCQRTSLPISSCGNSSLPISSCKTSSLFLSPKRPSFLLCSQDESLKSLPRKHTHSPKCAKDEWQDPPCLSQQQQLQYENYGASNQNYISNGKPMHPPSPPVSLCQPLDAKSANESNFPFQPQFPCALPSLDMHNCCCGKCKCGESSQMKNQKRCFHCGHFHSCCCGMCRCPNSNCPKSPYGQYNSPPISFSRQEMAFKCQQKLPTRLIKLPSPSLKKKEFKDHYANCCISQDSHSRRRSYLHNTRKYESSLFFEHNSNAENYVLQPLSIYKTRPNNNKKNPMEQLCQSRAQWSPTMWSPMTMPYNCCCQRCLMGETCTSKLKK